MKDRSELSFKIATEAWEFDQIHRLNHLTFTEEIPQHTPRPDGELVDRFHGENTYVVGLDGSSVVAMMALRDHRPFSLDLKLEDLESYLPKNRKVCEIRLLSVDRDHRNGRVFFGLMRTMAEHCLSRGLDMALISGILKQQKLYRHMGFVPFGPVVGTGDASFQPMYLTLEAFVERARPLLQGVRFVPKDPLNFLPGPVSIAPPVREAFSWTPISTRTERFHEAFDGTLGLLCELSRARRVEIFMGSGTLANDVIAAQLSLLGEPGIVVSAGEFGERLIDHASRARLPFRAERLEWGTPLDEARIRGILEAGPEARWLWTVHCESSTGMLSDLKLLKACCTEGGLKLCMDCVSSLGVVPLDLGGIFLSSSVSGKALGAYPGLGMVFSEGTFQPAPERLPRYLDLGYYTAKGGIPFTLSSNLVFALRTALETTRWAERFGVIAGLASHLRRRLGNLGVRILADEGHALPAIHTLPLAPPLDSGLIGDELERQGFLVSYRSEYLLRRNWIQICLMGQTSQQDLDAVLDALAGLLRPPD